MDPNYSGHCCDQKLRQTKHMRCVPTRYGQRCPNGVLCPFSHGAKEQLYHPHYFKTVVCWDFTHTKARRKRSFKLLRDALLFWRRRIIENKTLFLSVFVSSDRKCNVKNVEEKVPEEQTQGSLSQEGCPRERLCAFYHRKRTQRKGGHTVRNRLGCHCIFREFPTILSDNFSST